MNYTISNTAHIKNNDCCGNYFQELQAGIKSACHGRNPNNLICKQIRKLSFFGLCLSYVHDSRMPDNDHQKDNKVK